MKIKLNQSKIMNNPRYAECNFLPIYYKYTIYKTIPVLPEYYDKIGIYNLNKISFKDSECKNNLEREYSSRLIVSSKSITFSDKANNMQVMNPIPPYLTLQINKPINILKKSAKYSKYEIYFDDLYIAKNLLLV